jgi:hypothetical protein
MTRDDGDATQLAALFKNAVVGVVKSRRIEMKNQLHSIRHTSTHARTRARDGTVTTTERRRWCR